MAVKPKGRVMVMYTLHHAGELRTMEGIDELNSVPETVKLEEIKLARQLSTLIMPRSISPPIMTSMSKASRR